MRVAAACNVDIVPVSRTQVEVCYITLDMTDTAAIAKVHDKLPQGFNEIDILVNNAGLALGTAAGHEVEMDVRCTPLGGSLRGRKASTVQLPVASGDKWTRQTRHAVVAQRVAAGGAIGLPCACRTFAPC